MTFQCKLPLWQPHLRYTPQEIFDKLKLKVETVAENRGQTSLKPVKQKTFSTANKIYDKSVLRKIGLLLNYIDPDSVRDVWLRVGMGIFHETKGSDEGLVLFDSWSKKGKKYKGIRDIEKTWRSLRLDVPNPVTIGTLIKFAKDAGADVAFIMGFAEFEVKS